MKKNKLYMMIGCPGSGKSTYAKTHFTNATYVSRDEIRFKLVPEDEEYFSKEDEVFTTFINMIDKELKLGNDVIADATHLNSFSRMKLLASLDIDKNKTEIVAVFMNTPLDICIKRNENRKGTRAYVPKSVIRRMFFSLKKPNRKECCSMIDTIQIIPEVGVL